jgi:ABC-2 type transport system permease protein
VSALTGVRTLLPVTARVNARSIAPWIAGVTALSVSSILAYRLIFTDIADRKQLAGALAGNPALSLIFGPARDLLTNDGFNAWRSGALGSFFAALMAILTVVNTSRADEDSGQAELLASSVLGRQARLGVAVALAALASVVLGVVCFLLTIAVGGAVVPSALLAATFTASGLMFTGVAAVAVQLGSEARSASSIAIAVLGICFVIRGFIDSIEAPGWASWATPFGWLEHISPGTDNNPWPLLAAGALAIVLVVAGFVLDGRRDYGAGIIAPRPGPARAGPVGSIWGLAIRLNRGSVITWLIAFAGLGVVFGYLATSLPDILANNPALGGVLAAGGGAVANLTFAFLVTILQMIGLIAAIAGVQIVNRIVLEENNFRVEPLLAAALRRPKYLTSNLLVAYLTPAACLLIGATVIGTVAAPAGTEAAFGDVLAQGALTIPAVWTLVALSAAVVGARPALQLAGWLGVIAAFGLTILGPTFKLPNWVLAISPLRHVPNVTAAELHWTGLLAVVAVFLALNVVAFVGFRRRDVM